MAFLPRSFIVPERVVTDAFCIRSITIHDVLKDFDAVMSSREHLWARFGEEWGWPPQEMTIEQNLIDLGWHQKEFQLRSSFDYAVMSLDESRLLGCIYIDPPFVGDSEPGGETAGEAGVDAEVAYWIRSSELASGLETELGTFVRQWIAEVWPFARVAYPYNEE